MPELALEKRFTSKIDASGNCWIWLASKDQCGYGRFAIGNGKYDRAHRVMWVGVNGAIPDGMNVLHRCDNPSCCNPAHLFLGTHQDNMRDRDRKGRNAKGERLGISKLTNEDVAKIRSYPSGVSQYKIADEFGIAPSTVWYVRNKKTWKHL